MKELFLHIVENIVAKVIIDHYYHYEQFLLLPQCFQKSSAADVQYVSALWESQFNSNYGMHKYLLQFTQCFQYAYVLHKQLTCRTSQ